MTETVTWFDDGEQPVGTVGGKGRALGVLRSIGLDVPEGFVVGADAYRRQVEAMRAEIDELVAPLREREPPDDSAIDVISAQVRELVLAAAVDAADEAAIREAYSLLGERLDAAEPAVAIRSSSAAEDSAHHSFAGEHDSYLWVIGADAVVDAVRRCWASLFTSRAVSYRLDAGALADDAMAVVVQRMVDARSAGVFMTLNPSNGDRSKLVIESVWGLGEPLVSGIVTPDRFVVDKITREILERVPADKPTQVVREPDTGVGFAERPLDEERRGALSLTDDEVLALVEVARRVETHAQCPQDGEFVIADSHIYLVQARPETAWTSRPQHPVTSGTPDPLAHVLGALGARTSGDDARDHRPSPAGSHRPERDRIVTAATFPSPFDVETPSGAEGWESMYNWYHLFGEDRRDADEKKFWFQDALHHPYVLYPYDEIQCECWWQALGTMNTRVFAVPPAFGVEQRVLNGRLYISPVEAPAEHVAERGEAFAERAGHYYRQWDAIYEEWKDKVRERIDLVRDLHFAPLPDREPVESVTGHVGHSAGFRWERDFSLMVSTMYETYQWHFEMLNIGYASYLTFFEFCQKAFPGMSDQSASRMVGGQHVDLYRPDDELKRLSKEAERLGVGDTLLESPDIDSALKSMSATAAGEQWRSDWEATRHPWFDINCDPGHPGGDHRFGTWNDHLDIPFTSIRTYVERLRRGETIDRPTERILAERERISAEYRSLLALEDATVFDNLLALARQVFRYIEEHVLYIEHWMWAAFWSKSRELAESLVTMGVLAETEDLFLLRRTEVAELIFDTVAAWSTGAPGRGRAYWSPVIARRREIFRALEASDPPPALGPPPPQVSEPLTVMLWGITTDSVAGWLAAEGDADPDVLRGVAGSPGVVEGPVRVVRSAAQLAAVRSGDVLVCPATSPAWAPAFSRVAATVSDVGGIMSHTAIVCREYGLPAVVGTGRAVTTLRDGQRVRVDGGTGIVTVLE